MKTWMLLLIVFGWATGALVMAQEEQMDFFEKYLPIATWFDSPVTFGVVVGSGAILLIAALVFLYVVKSLEKQAEDWGKTQSPESLVQALGSGDSNLSRKAFVYLRKHGTQDEISLIVAKLQEQRQKGQINPDLIFLVEDLQASSAIPVLQQIARGKSQAAPMAEKALQRITGKEEADTTPAPQT